MLLSDKKVERLNDFLSGLMGCKTGPFVAFGTPRVGSLFWGALGLFQHQPRARLGIRWLSFYHKLKHKLAPYY